VSGKWVRGGERPKPRRGVLIEARPYELHGTKYYAVRYRLDDDPAGGSREARMSFDMIYDDPLPGEAILVESVLNVVDRVRRAR